jgi:predicted SnoaL-like aldol condensation-catalyzing enzyme
MKLIAGLALSLLFFAASVTSQSYYCPPAPASESTQLLLFNTFVQAFYIHKDAKTAFTNFVSEDYIQHNPSALSGRQTALDFLSPILPSLNITILHQGLYGGIGYIHYKEDIPGLPSQAVTDIFRFNGTCIMEHWDVVQVRPEHPINPLALW